MEVAEVHDASNPLADLIEDDLYQVLDSRRLLNHKGIRDYQIRKRFREMRDSEVPALQAIKLLREEHPYLQFDTVRKIVYNLSGKK